MATVTESKPDTKPISYNWYIPNGTTKTFMIRGIVTPETTITLNFKCTADSLDWTYTFTSGTANTVTTNSVTVAYDGGKEFVVTNNGSFSSQITFDSIVYDGRPARIMAMDTNMNPLNLETRISSSNKSVTYDEPIVISAGNYGSASIQVVPNGGVPLGIEKIKYTTSDGYMYLCLVNFEIYSNGYLQVYFYNPKTTAITITGLSASARYLKTTEIEPPGLYVYEQA